MLNSSLIDLPVLLVFFNRPDSFAQVFEAVRKARPSKLFLACDGAREGSNDAALIEECKKIAEKIDWECEVRRKYSDVNLGCGRGPSSAISWAFEFVDRLVILEDDCVPDPGFFSYQKECLEKYKDDERVCAVSGLNHLFKWDCGDASYFFARNCVGLWGWGTWKRVWKEYDYELKELENPYLCRLLTYNLKKEAKGRGLSRITTWKSSRAAILRGEKFSAWDIQFGFLKITQSHLGIVPKHNLIHNIGVGETSTHNKSGVIKEWRLGSIHLMPTKPLEEPLVHQDFIVCDWEYENRVDKIFMPSKYSPVHIVKRALRLIKRLASR